MIDSSERNHSGLTPSLMIEMGIAKVFALAGHFLSDNTQDQAAFIKAGGVSLLSDRFESIQLRYFLAIFVICCV